MAVLYDLAMIIGGEVQLRPLLTKSLQRILYHTSFPVGLVFLEPPRPAAGGGVEARLELVIGDYELAALAGHTVPLSPGLLEGKAELRMDRELLAKLPHASRSYGAFLRLPLENQGVVILLAPEPPHSDLPLEHVFQPVMANLARAILMCRRHEAYEIELRQAQNLEAIGRLAAGIAHEINTPIQFIADSTQFLGESVEALFRIVDAYAAAVPPDAREALRALEEEADFAFLREQLPKSIERTLAGVDRVAAIVRGMKEFAHPDGGQICATDLNRSIGVALEVARHEYKHLADVETELAQLPLIHCHPGEVNQVLLNLLVNAAHAIADWNKGSARRGTIRVSTRLEKDHVVISIADTGTGIPVEVRDKVFNPFFTTKEVGRGTGQGLAISRGIVKKHRGTLWFETEVGRGTTFYVRIPIIDPGPQTTPP